MLKSLVQRSPIYPAVRSAYRAVFKASQIIASARMGAFYAQFFQPGEIVFDIGANQGEYSECFAKEGAKVIAVEPNEGHRPRLQALSAFLNVTPEFVAIADKPGTATLNICSTSGYSTLVGADSDWIANSPDYKGVDWVGKTQVKTMTLDALAEKHGIPSFVKIDIEGYELAALEGMSFKPRYVSFEYGVRRKEIALGCITRLGEEGYRFRPIDGRDFRFSTAEWMDDEAAAAWLRSRTLEHGEYGDLFAHRRAT